MRAARAVAVDLSKTHSVPTFTPDGFGVPYEPPHEPQLPQEVRQQLADWAKAARGRNHYRDAYRVERALMALK